MATDPRIIYEFGPFRMDPDKQILRRGDDVVPVTPKAFEILLILVRCSREVVSKEELLKEVWPNSFVEESNLSQNIFLLRKALEEPTRKNRQTDILLRCRDEATDLPRRSAPLLSKAKPWWPRHGHAPKL